MRAGNPEKYGKYEVLRPLATGGMADLFLARARGLHGFETLAVVKRIRPHLAANPEFVRLFLDEARLAAQLRHPNVVHVYDIGQERGEYFFVMEYLHGRDLRAVIEAARKLGRYLTFDEALSIAVGLCAGLHHAHERLDSSGRPLGLVHRDISPSNVMIDFEGNIKLMDFGIAKATQLANRKEGDTNSLRGKLSYMSPEQCLGKPLDRRTDLYSLAVVLYELTTFGKPHGKVAASEFLALKQTLEAPIRPPSLKRSDFPPELEAIIVRGLARDRDDRWSSARELQLELEAFARKQQLALSGVTLARLMEELFPNDLHAWQEAQSRGASLSQHLEESHTMSLQAASPMSALSPGLVLSEQRTQSLVRPPTRISDDDFEDDDSDDEPESASLSAHEPFQALDSSLEVALAKRKRARNRLTAVTAVGALLLFATSAIAVVAGGHKDRARDAAQAAAASASATNPAVNPSATTNSAANRVTNPAATTSAANGAMNPAATTNSAANRATNPAATNSAANGVPNPAATNSAANGVPNPAATNSAANGAPNRANGAPTNRGATAAKMGNRAPNAATGAPMMTRARMTAPSSTAAAANDDAAPRPSLVRAGVTPARTRHVATKKPVRAQASGWDPEAPLLPH